MKKQWVSVVEQGAKVNIRQSKRAGEMERWNNSMAGTTLKQVPFTYTSLDIDVPIRWGWSDIIFLSRLLKTERSGESRERHRTAFC